MIVKELVYGQGRGSVDAPLFYLKCDDCGGTTDEVLSLSDARRLIRNSRGRWRWINGELLCDECVAWRASRCGEVVSA